MQQMIPNQRSLQPIIFQKLMCCHGNQANSMCVSSFCTESGLMCLAQKCLCRKKHLKCHHLLVQRVIQSISLHQKEKPKDVIKFYQSVYKMINEMIDQLSNMRQEFQLEEKYFGLQKSQLKFINLLNQSKINYINGQLISQLEKTFQVQAQIEKFNQQSVQQKIKNTMKRFDELNFHIQNTYSQSKKNKNLNFLDNSLIVKEEWDVSTLREWLLQDNPSGNFKSKLLFRASEHGFGAKDFHALCDYHPNTLVIIKNQYDKVFGGFTQGNWFSPSGFQYVKNTKSFIFSLSNKQKYECIQPARSIRCSADYGPSFGSGSPACDILIKSNCNVTADSYCNFPKSYNLKDRRYQNNKQTAFMITGNPNGANTFKVKDYQVFQIFEH